MFLSFQLSQKIVKYTNNNVWCFDLYCFCNRVNTPLSKELQNGVHITDRTCKIWHLDYNVDIYVSSFVPEFTNITKKSMHVLLF
jgi:hypothetical protein